MDAASESPKWRNAPCSIEGVQEIVRSAEKLFILGRGTKTLWSVRSSVPEEPVSDIDASAVGLRRLRGIVDYSWQDQVVTALAGTRIFEMQRMLRERNQCLPLGPCGPESLARGSLGGSIAMNLPHLLEGRYGNWRDWILGMKVVLADGTLATCGSHAVKSVAGYDVQKLFVGSRGTLGIVVEVTLRTFPCVQMAEPMAELKRIRRAVQRVARSDYAEAASNLGRPYIGDHETGTLWFSLEKDGELRRYEGDWLLRTLAGKRNLEFTDQTQIRLMKRAKEIFDPTHKLNPGEMGIF
ncbi:MAG TPA: FAD-binding oxidoreductase [Fimbriimonadaceae bacterium]|nr:FAD-binding oxidoreductase [Fimbriimonadaceae bacterium]